MSFLKIKIKWKALRKKIFKKLKHPDEFSLHTSSIPTDLLMSKKQHASQMKPIICKCVCKVRSGRVEISISQKSQIWTSKPHFSTDFNFFFATIYDFPTPIYQEGVNTTKKKFLGSQICSLGHARCQKSQKLASRPQFSIFFENFFATIYVFPIPTHQVGVDTTKRKFLGSQILTHGLTCNQKS